MTSRAKFATASILAALALTACSPAGSTTAGTASPTGSSALSPAAPVTLGQTEQVPAGQYPTLTQPAWDERSYKSAMETATKAMTLYARPSVDAKTWIQDLGQLMTSKAVADYQDVDPATIPATAVTGQGKLTIETGNGFGCHVQFSTNAGTYDVQLLRSAADKPWQVNKFTPPSDAK